MNIQFNNWQSIDLNAVDNAFTAGVNEFSTLLNSFDPDFVGVSSSTNTRFTGDWNGLAVDVRGNHFIDSYPIQTVNSLSLIDVSLNFFVSGSVSHNFNTGLTSGFYNKYSYTSTNAAGLTNLLFLGTLNVDSFGNLANSTLTQQNITSNGYTLNTTGNFNLDALGNVTGGTITGFTFIDNLGHSLVVSGASLNAVDFDHLTDPLTHTTLTNWYAYLTDSAKLAGNDNIIGDAQDNSINGFSGDDTLNGGGGADSLNGGKGNDTYIVNMLDGIDTITEDVTYALGGGIDLVKSKGSFTLGANLDNLTLTDGSTNGGFDLADGIGNEINNIIIGNAGNNVIIGNAGNDTLTGNAGDDTLDGGLGADNMNGGAGNDYYVVDSISDIVTESIAKLPVGATGIDGGTDTVQASISYTLGLNVDNLILTNSPLTTPNANNLNGVGNTLDNSIIGNDGNNYLSGLAGLDTLNGGAGNDTLDGGLGIDVLIGGTGDDTYIVDLITTAAVIATATTTATPAFVTLEDQIVENAGEGIDTLILRGSAVLVTPTTIDLTGTYSYGNTLSNIDNLNASATGATKLNLIGNGLDNKLTGNAADNLINGGLGADTLIGGAGNDTYVVDNADDIITELLNSGIDTVQSSITYSLIDTDGAGTTAINGGNVENLTLTDGTAGGGISNINATGNAFNNILIGNAGNNTLDGLAGNDSLNGGDGNDTLYGRAGLDTLDGGAGIDSLYGGDGADIYLVDDSADIVTEDNALAAGGIDLVKSTAASFTLSANVENLTLNGTGDINANGNGLANTIIGNTGNNIIDGGAGIDNLTGGLGNDTYIVDLTATGLLQDTVTEGISLVDTADAIQLRGTSTNTITSTIILGANIEILDASQTGNSKLNFTGNALNNSLYGNAADNILDGSTGTDALYGGDGNDTYLTDLSTTGAGALAITSLQDSLTEYANEGIDTLKLRGAATLINASTLTLGDNIENLDASLTGATKLNLTGNALDNKLTGNAAANSIDGSDGNDMLDGGAGIDTLNGGAGDDTYMVDVAGNISTGLGGDIIIDAEGNDTVITKFTANLSSPQFANIENMTLFTGAAPLSATGNAGNNTLIGNDAGNTLDGGGGADSLNGGKGNDTYIVNMLDGIDTITEDVTYALGGGIDLVKSKGSFTLGANLDNLTLTDGSTNGGFDLADGIGNEINNIIIGNAGNNVIIGNAGNDTLTGNAGDDTLDGGLGADNMNGGAGNDYYVVDSISDIVTESIAKLPVGATGIDGGTDTVQASISYTLGLNVDNLILTNSPLTTPNANNLNGVGNTLDNSIIGNDGNNYLSGLAGLDTLNGGAGNDTLDGGLGIDVLIGGTGDDTYIVDLITTAAVIATATTTATPAFVTLEDQIVENAGEGIDTLILRGSAVLVTPTTIDLTGTYSYGNTLSNIDNLNASATGATKLNLIGNGLDNKLTGNAANNTLIGNAGNDTLDGGLGADTLLGGFGDDVYIIDNVGDVIIEAPKVVSILTTTSSGGLPNSSASTGSLSADGTKLVFTSYASFVNEDLNGKADIYVKNLITGDVQLASTSSLGLQGQGFPSASGDEYGIFSHDSNAVLFQTDNTDLVPNINTNAVGQIYIKNLTTGTLKLVSANAAGDAGNGISDEMNISNNDRYVIFDSESTNLVAGGTNGFKQLYIKDLTTGGMQLVSTTNALYTNNLASQGNGDSTYASFSPDGNSIIFVSAANNLVSNDTNNVADVFVKNLVTGAVRLVSSSATGATADGGSSHASFSADGRYVAFQTSAINLIPGLDSDGAHSNLYRKDLLTGAIVAIDTSADGVIGNLQGEYPTLSADGRYAVFTSLANNLVANDTNNDFDVFIKDMQTGDIRLVSTFADGTQLNGYSYVNRYNVPSISADGNTIIFEAFDSSPNLSGLELVFSTSNPFRIGDGVDRVESSISFDLSAKGQDIENLTLTGAAAINGTGNVLSNIIIGNDAANSLDGKGGADTLIGGKGNDTYFVDHAGDVVEELLTIAQGGGVDLVKSSIDNYQLTDNVDNLTLITTGVNAVGNALNNVLTGNDANNNLYGGAGNDALIGGLGNDFLSGDLGVDNLSGGKGDDSYNVDLIKLGTGAASYVVLQDVVNELANEGTDTIYLSNSYGIANADLTNATALALAVNIENINASQTGDIKLNITGNAAANDIIGNAANNVLIGGLGADGLTGGGGADVFKFNATTESTVGLLHDLILDFSSLEGDKIDLSVIDAQTNIAGNQAFNFIGNNFGGDVVFTHQSGQLIFDTGTEILSGDVNGDGIADFEIELLGVNSMSASDFVL